MSLIDELEPETPDIAKAPSKPTEGLDVWVSAMDSILAKCRYAPLNVPDTTGLQGYGQASKLLLACTDMASVERRFSCKSDRSPAVTVAVAQTARSGVMPDMSVLEPMNSSSSGIFEPLAMDGERPEFLNTEADDIWERTATPAQLFDLGVRVSADAVDGWTSASQYLRGVRHISSQPAQLKVPQPPSPETTTVTYAVAKSMRDSMFPLGDVFDRVVGTGSPKFTRRGVSDSTGFSGGGYSTRQLPATPLLPVDPIEHQRTPTRGGDGTVESQSWYACTIAACVTTVAISLVSAAW